MASALAVIVAVGRPIAKDSPSRRAGGSAAMSRTALARLAAPAAINAARTRPGLASSAMAVARRARTRSSATTP